MVSYATQPWQWSIRDLLEAIQSKDLSCFECMQNILDHAQKQNVILNALPEILYENALATARRLDMYSLREIEQKPLISLPISIKMNIDQKGCVTSNGVPAYTNRLAKKDAPLVRLLSSQGAIPFARSNVSEFSLRWDSENPLYGRTINPRNHSITAGGSSSGAAASVASGMNVVAIGNDNGGSIRYPAFACGVVGFRPTPGRVPWYNATDPVERGLSAQLMSVNGPLARTLDDAIFFLEHMSQVCPEDPLGVPACWFSQSVNQNTPIAFFYGGSNYLADADIKLALDEARKRIEDSGLPTEEVAPPHFAETASLWSHLTYDDRRGAAFAHLMDVGSPAIENTVRYIQNIFPEKGRAEYLIALQRRIEILREWGVFFRRYPALVMPVSWKVPFLCNGDVGTQDIFKSLLHAQSPLLVPSCLGLPSASVPVRLPCGSLSGVQVISWRFHEKTVHSVGKRLEEPFTFAVV